MTWARFGVGLQCLLLCVSMCERCKPFRGPTHTLEVHINLVLGPVLQRLLTDCCCAVLCCSVPCCAVQITTVDKYQGQQNDFVLLSLVRTRVVGHLRDVRRLVVALSR
jgi:hypothetical protein